MNKSKGFKFKGGKGKPIEKKEIVDKISAHFAPPPRSLKTRDDIEDELIECVDDKTIFIELCKEMNKSWKKIRNLKDVDSIMHIAAPKAAFMLYNSIFSPDKKIRLEASKEVLNRTHGKPVERQMNLNANLNSLSKEEASREIVRIFTKLRPTVIDTEARDVGGGGDHPTPQDVEG